jgi:PAS domain S-box-containing protein
MPPPEAGNRYSVHLNTEGRIVALDARLEQASGYPSADLVGKHFVDFLHREDIASAVSLFSATLLRGDGGRLAVRYRHSSAAWRRVDVDLHRNSAEARTGVDVWITCSSEHRRVVDTPVEPPDLRTLLELTTDGFVVHNASGGIVTCNPAAERILGLDLDQMRGRTSIDPRWRAVREDGSSFPGEAHPAMVTLRTGVPQQGVIMGVYKTDGTLSWISVRTAPLQEPGTLRPQGVVAEFHDLTERRHAEALLRASTLEMEDLYNNAPCGYHSIDHEGRFLRMNDTELRWLGYSRAEVVGRMGIADIAGDSSEERIQQAFTQFMRDGYLRDHQLEFRRKDGSALPVMLSATAIRDSHGTIVASRSTVYDMTRRKEEERRMQHMNQLLEQRIEQRTAELQNAAAEMEAFAYAVSHDLQAPVRAINAFGEMLRTDHAVSLNDDGKALLARVVAANGRQKQMIDDLLGLSRASTAQIVRTLLNVSELARSVLAAVAQADPSRSVDSSVQAGMQAFADRGLLRIVFENLLGNAWKFTGKTPAAKIEAGSVLRGDATIYFVRDNGAGFSMTDASALFSPFRRMHHADEFPGTGIGLATVQRIIRRHGGRVWIESTPGMGTSVFFTLGADPG